MYIGLFDVWKRILQSLGLIPPENSNFVLDKSAFLQQNRVKPPKFDSSKQVRVLLFRELNGQERRLLFDSKAVLKRDGTASPGGGRPLKGAIHNRRMQESSIEKSFKLSEHQSREYVYEWQKSSSDEILLREMIFGAVSISYQGTTLKVHTIRSPSQIMLSVVFPAPPAHPVCRPEEPETEESGTWTTNSVEINICKCSEKSDTHLAHSVPVNVPSRLSGQFAETRDSDSDSLQSLDGHSSLPTNHLSPETPRMGLPRSSSYNSLQRRILRNKATSIELGLPKSEDGSSDYSGTPGQRRSKLGLSIVITLDEDENKFENKQFCDFLFTHISLIEGHIMCLKDTVVRAYLNRKNFVHLMFEGSKKFQSCLNDLYTAPRLPNPEWLTIISSPHHRHLSYSFLEKFASLLKQYDKKETNFFVSTLLTAVLTHHLAWVPSVIPTGSKIQSTQSSHKHTPYWVDLLAKSRPYNPLWVQLSDLYGALGVPLKLTKTVVKGQKKDIVFKFLQILSYFIRCSDICQQNYEATDNSFAESAISNSGVSSQDSHRNSTTSQQIDSKVTTQIENIQSMPLQNSSIHNSPVSKLSLPRNLSVSLATDVDCTSDSFKDTCDFINTPTKPDCVAINVSELSLPNVSKDAIKTSALDSLGYMSLEEKLETIDSSKRMALREQPTNFCHRLSSSGSSNICPKIGKENDPMTFEELSCKVLKTKSSCECHVSKAKLCDCQESCSKSPRTSCRSCPYSDNPAGDLRFSKDDSKVVKECESIEEGYHSMEEPHSPKQERVHLGEMLKRLENWYPEGIKEIQLPEFDHMGDSADPIPFKSFGWSLMADISDHYLKDFCLQGVSGPLYEEEIRDDLVQSTHIQILGEPVSESICLVADTDKWSVRLLSSHFVSGDRPNTIGTTIAMSSLVSGICDAVMNMVDLGIPPESCLIYLEDRLQELYTRSQTLADFVQSSNGPVAQSRITSVLNVDTSDIPLLLSIATTHSPNLSVYSR